MASTAKLFVSKWDALKQCYIYQRRATLYPYEAERLIRFMHHTAPMHCFYKYILDYEGQRYTAFYAHADAEFYAEYCRKQNMPPVYNQLMPLL